MPVSELFQDRMGSLFVVGFAATKWDARVLGEEGSIEEIVPVSSRLPGASVRPAAFPAGIGRCNVVPLIP